MTDTDAADLDWRLQDQREFLQRSLEDAAREHAAGDLTDEDYAVLRRRDEDRLASVEASIAERTAAARAAATVEAQDVAAASATSASGIDAGGASGSKGKGDTTPEGEDGDESPRAEASGGRGALPRRRWRIRRRWWFAVVGVAALVAGALVLVHALTSPLLPGESETGSIDLNTAQEVQRQLAQAKTLAKAGKASEALEVYGDVLAEDPKQPVALAEWGWLDWEAASKAKEPRVAAEGASALEESVRLDKKLYAAQYYLGTVLVQEGDAKEAVHHFATFLDDEPTASWLKEAAPEIRTAYRAAGEAVPSDVPST